MTDFTFAVTEEEGNAIISALAVKPFQEVVVLVSKIQAQYQQQVAVNNQAAALAALEVPAAVKEDGSPA